MPDYSIHFFGFPQKQDFLVEVLLLGKRDTLYVWRFDGSSGPSPALIQSVLIHVAMVTCILSHVGNND